MKLKRNNIIDFVIFCTLFVFTLITSVLLLHNYAFLGHSPLTWEEIGKGLWKFILTSAVGSLICTINIKHYLH